MRRYYQHLETTSDEMGAPRSRRLHSLLLTGAANGETADAISRTKKATFIQDPARSWLFNSSDTSDADFLFCFPFFAQNLNHHEEFNWLHEPKGTVPLQPLNSPPKGRHYFFFMGAVAGFWLITGRCIDSVSP